MTDIKAYIDIKDSAYKAASPMFGRDIISKPIQDDWQKLLDAIDNKSLNELRRLEGKYEKDEQRDQPSGGGAGPGKVTQSRRGAAQIPRFARQARIIIQELH